MKPIAILNGMHAPHMRLLIVEDEPEHAEILMKILKQLGFRWLCHVATLKEAKQELERRKYDLLLTDCNLPDGSGLELAEALSIPSIMLTAHRGQEHVEQAQKAGVTQFIGKPFTAEVLRQKILRAFDQSAE